LHVLLIEYKFFDELFTFYNRDPVHGPFGPEPASRKTFPQAGIAKAGAGYACLKKIVPRNQ
jgi:hypothetical protein